MDYLWLGQYISGINEQIIFNFNYAIMPGILTPSQNLPKDLIECLEICSSSWVNYLILMIFHYYILLLINYKIG